MERIAAIRARQFNAALLLPLHNDMVVCDDEGQDLPDVAAAQEAALKNAKAMAAASILELPFRDVVKVEGL